VICSLIIIARELIITCFRTIAATKEVILAADYLGKIKTVTQLIGLIFILPAPAFLVFNEVLGNIILYIVFVFLVIATLLTIASAINYIYKNLQVLIEDKKSLKKINKKLEELASKAHILLLNSSYTVSIAESFTGGRIASELIKNAGASAVIKEAIVCYDAISKMDRLGVEQSVIEQYGVVSERVAVDMSVGLLNSPLKPDFTISTNVNVGPSMEIGNNDMVGYICISDENFSAPIKVDLDGDRKYNIALGSIRALEALISIIEKDKFKKKID
jgi:PncC family amidohydrolase